MANRKGFLLTSLATVAGAAVTSFAMSEHLFKIAFKRVNYVPETSEEKQKYADEYWAYVDWFKQVEKERYLPLVHQFQIVWLNYIQCRDIFNIVN